MRALAYLLGARALDIARDATPVRPLPETPMGPIATTRETASAWRRWVDGRDASPAVIDRQPVRARSSRQPKPTPI
jgi:hypothetical protein